MWCKKFSGSLGTKQYGHFGKFSTSPSRWIWRLLLGLLLPETRFKVLESQLSLKRVFAIAFFDSASTCFSSRKAVSLGTPIGHPFTCTKDTIWLGTELWISLVSLEECFPNVSWRYWRSWESLPSLRTGVSLPDALKSTSTRGCRNYDPWDYCKACNFICCSRL